MATLAIQPSEVTALFLALSDDIGHVAYVDGFSQPNRAVTNAVWLWSVLREANVMI